MAAMGLFQLTLSPIHVAGQTLNLWSAQHNVNDLWGRGVIINRSLLMGFGFSVVSGLCGVES